MRRPSQPAAPALVRAESFVPGIPRVSYRPPVIVTLLAAVLVFVVLAILTVFAVLNTLTQVGRGTGGGQGFSPVAAGCCGILSIVGIVGTVYFMLAVIKGVRDLWTPLHYTRGSLIDKRTIGGRMAGNWVGVSPSYIGTDVEAASGVTDEQRAASVDRSKIFQPRFTPAAAGTKPGAHQPGSYLPAGRVTADSPEIMPARNAESAYIPRSRVTSASLPAEEERGPRVVFRIEQAAFDALEPGDEVLVAHTRYLQHIFFVSILKDGEWASLRNKALI